MTWTEHEFQYPLSHDLLACWNLFYLVNMLIQLSLWIRLRNLDIKTAQKKIKSKLCLILHQPQSDKMCCENIFADDNFNLGWRVHLYFCRIFHQFDNLTISKSKIKVADSFQNMIKWSLAIWSSAVVSFPESLRVFS